MSTTAYKLFINQIMTIAKTAVIKHNEAAIIMNHILISKGYSIDWNAPYTWRYYLNLAGEYHQADFDELSVINNNASNRLLIKVASNAGPINANFTKSLIDAVTGDVTLANEFAFGKDFYKDLVRRYPDHEALILGILNPVNITEAIEAPDNTILYCGNYYRTKITNALGVHYAFKKRDTLGLDDPNLIESHEVDIIQTLQQFVTAFVSRWFNNDYNFIDDMYLTSFLGVLYSQIPVQLFNARLANCHTNKAHSFHIRSFLQSHGKLGKYISALPLKQLLFLYRNIRWIEKNTGKEETFKLLVDELATPCNVPLTGYLLKHDTSNLPEEEFPEPLLQRDVINFIQTGTQTTTVSIERMLEREKDITRENSRDLASVAKEMKYKLARAWDTELPTKIIESDMIDNTTRLPYKLEDVLFHHWVYTATQGAYTANIFVTNPRDASRILVTPLTALILAIYCINKGYTGEAPVNVPTLIAKNIPKALIDIPAIQAHIESKRVSLVTINTLIGLNPRPITFNSNETFFNGCKVIHQEMLRRYYEIAKEEALVARGQLDYVIQAFYTRELPCPLVTTPISYNQWLLDNGFTFDNFTAEDFIAFGTALITEATGNNINTTQSLGNLQQAVIEIMKQFSSYSVQYLYQINPDNTLLLFLKSLRADNVISSTRANARIPLGLITAGNLTFRPNDTLIPTQSVPSVV